MKKWINNHVKLVAILLLFLCTTISASATENLDAEVTKTLAFELFAEENFDQSATEFRRFAMQTDDESEEASAYLFAGLSYLENNQFEIVQEMLDRSEESDKNSAFNVERGLLSAEVARELGDLDYAIYNYEIVASEPGEFKDFANRKAAVLDFQQGNFDSAKARLKNSPAELAAIDAYLNGRDKSPKVGALWGLIPGAGYFYSGEYANGFRSLILNTIFLYGMAHTASEEQWGAFTVITFFELTWYSGSIYGGVDSANRYNKRRLEDAMREIEGASYLRPDETVLPLFRFKVGF